MRGGNKETDCKLCLIMRKQTFKALFRVLLCHLKGQGVEEKFVYCESGEEDL